MAKELINILMVINIQEISKMVNVIILENINIWIKTYIKVNGKMILDKVKG